MGRNLRIIFSMLTAIFVLSCSSPSGEASAEMDAGVEWVKMHSWELDDPEIFPYPRFFGVTDRNELIVIDQSLLTISLVDENGDLKRSFGGRGEGPGEFSQITHAAVHPDGRVAVADNGNARITIINTETGSIQSHSYEPGWHTRLQWVGDELVLSNNPFRIGESHPGDVIFRKIDTETGEKEEIMHLELELSDPPFEQISCTFCAFRFRSDFSFYTSPQDTSYRVFRVDPDTGDEQLFTRRGVPAVELSPAEREQLAERNRQAGASVGMSSDGYTPPTHHRRFVDFFPDEQGRLWTLLNTGGENPLRFDIFSGEGDYIGSTTAPEQTAEISYAGDNRILIRYSSDDPEVWKAELFRVEWD